MRVTLDLNVSILAFAFRHRWLLSVEVAAQVPVDMCAKLTLALLGPL